MIPVYVILFILALTALIQASLTVCLVLLQFCGRRGNGNCGNAFVCAKRSRLKEIMENWRASKAARLIGRRTVDNNGPKGAE